jgi:hypothetical protein
MDLGGCHIKEHDTLTTSQEFVRERGTDEPGPAGDQSGHVALHGANGKGRVKVAGYPQTPGPYMTSSLGQRRGSVNVFPVVTADARAITRKGEQVARLHKFRG